jgi:tripartite-type tricarboxylate transporter receptor subunit TctC
MRPRILAGKVKAIALTNSQHAESLKDIPTAREAGFKSLEMDGLVGLLGPKNMPLSIRDHIAADIRQALADPAVIAKLTTTGQILSPGSPSEFAESLKEQREKVAGIGKILGIKPAQQ